MGALKTRKKSNRGEAHCEICWEKIEVGEIYHLFSVRFMGTRIRCHKHPFRQSDMAQGRNGEVYAVQEYLKDWIDGKDSTEIVELLEGAISDLENTADGYEQGSSNIQEHFGNTFQTDDMDQKAETIREGMSQIETLKAQIEEAQGSNTEKEMSWQTRYALGDMLRKKGILSQHDPTPLAAEIKKIMKVTKITDKPLTNEEIKQELDGVIDQLAI